MTSYAARIISFAVGILWVTVMGCSGPSEPDAATVDATYITVLESDPPVGGELRCNDTLRLVFEYNIDSYDYSATSEYDFAFTYRQTQTRSGAVLFVEGRCTTTRRRGVLNARVVLSEICADTVLEPAVFGIRMHKKKDDWDALICWQLLQYQLVKE